MASEVAAGHPIAEVEQVLHERLAAFVAESGERGARSKTITVLLRIWSKAPPYGDGLRTEALSMFSLCNPREQLALHWGLTMLAYPFFLDVIKIVGRLVALQGTASLGEITRRVAERWGDRERVARSARHVVQSLRDWNVLTQGRNRGVYGATEKVRLESGNIAGWLLEALMIAERIPVLRLNDISTSPALFPFSITMSARELFSQRGQEIIRQGLDEDSVILREPIHHDTPR